MLPDWATAAADEGSRWNQTADRIERASRHESRALDGSLFALGSACFLIGPFPGYVQLVGESADAITFFVGSILFTAGGGLQSWLAWSERHSPVADARHGGPPSSSPPARCSSTSRRIKRWTPP